MLHIVLLLLLLFFLVLICFDDFAFVFAMFYLRSANYTCKKDNTEARSCSEISKLVLDIRQRSSSFYNSSIRVAIDSGFVMLVHLLLHIPLSTSATYKIRGNKYIKN